MGGVLRRIRHGLLDLALGQVGAGGDDDLLGTSGAQVAGGDFQDAVGVQVEGDFDLRDASRGTFDTGEAEFADALVIPRHRAFALEDVDLHRGLEIGRSAEDLGVMHRQGGIAVDKAGGHAAHCLNGQGERSHVQQQDLLARSGRLSFHRGQTAA